MAQYRLSTLFAKLFFFFVALSLLGSTPTLSAQTPFPDPGPVYRDDVVPRIDITLPPDSLAIILAPGNEESDYHFHATFNFDNGTVQETIENVGFRLRGNTSRYSEKKSFKVSFNTYESGRKWYGVEKLNLNGEHNDPTISRSKVCWDLLRNIGVPAPRANHVQLYINGTYYGLYANIEHIDEEFVDTRFGNKKGNLYKCLWPADLNYLGDDPDLYKLMNGNRRVYELKTNEEDDDYSDLAQFIDILNNTPTEALRCELEQLFNINSYLLSLAFDILSGNWDGPLYNKNNFYLYHNQATGKFDYIPYDLDNTFGIDWFNINWAERNLYTWGHPSEPRPLFWRIMEVPEYRNRFSYFMQQILEETYTEDNLFNRIDDLAALIEPYLSEDTFYPLDYGFDVQDFHDGFIEALPYGHTPIGLKPFISTRRAATIDQLQINDIAPIIDQVTNNQPDIAEGITIQAMVEDDQGLAGVEVCYQLEGLGDVYCLEMFDDGQHLDGEAGDHFYGAVIPALETSAVVYYYIQATDLNGLSSQEPFCGTRQLYVGSSSITLAINEFMASNDTTITDEAGDYEDWVEIHNYGNAPIYLGDLYLSDEATDPTKWQFPDTWIQPGQFLLIWTDDDEEEGDFHTNFKLSADGEYIGIFDSNSHGNGLIDGLEFSPLETDQAYGRLPNGTGAFQTLPATPGYSNEMISATNNWNPLIAYRLYPNPTQDVFYVETTEPVVPTQKVLLLNTFGQIIQEKSWQPRLMFNLKNWPSGLYFLGYWQGNQLQALGKVIKE